MRRYAVTFSFLACLLLAPQVCIGKTWRGITPLISTRLDVERILGNPVLDRNVYDTPEGRAIIYYSDGKPCEEGLPGLGNIPEGVVTEIYITLADRRKISDVLDPAKYTRVRAAHTQHIYYFDEEEGIRYTEIFGEVESVSYFGKRKDKQAFSCGEFKYAAPVPANPDPSLSDQPRLDSYGRIRFNDAKARLDNFSIQLSVLNEKRREYRGYIIVYAGRSAYRREAELTAQCSKEYLVKTRHTDPESLVAVDGGFREEFEVDLILGPINTYPPVLFPSVSPSKVQIREGRFKPCQ